MNWISAFLLCVLPFPPLNAGLPPPGGVYNQLVEVIDEATEDMNYYQTHMLMRKIFEIVRRKKQEMKTIKEINNDEKHEIRESPDENNDCVEEDYIEPNFHDFKRKQAVIGSVTDFPSDARDERNPNIYIGDNVGQRSGGINIPLIPKKKICKKSTPKNGYRYMGGYGLYPRQNSYLLERLQETRNVLQSLCNQLNIKMALNAIHAFKCDFKH